MLMLSVVSVLHGTNQIIFILSRAITDTRAKKITTENASSCVRGRAITGLSQMPQHMAFKLGCVFPRNRRLSRTFTASLRKSFSFAHRLFCVLLSLCSLRRQRYQSGLIQPPPISDCEHPIPSRRQRQLPRLLGAVGSIHHTPT